MQTNTLIELMKQIELMDYKTDASLPLVEDPTYLQLRKIAELIAKERPVEVLVKEVEYKTMGNKTTVCVITDVSGFEIVGSSACVNPDDFDIHIGMKWAYKDALDQLEGHHAYLQTHAMMHEREQREMLGGFQDEQA